MIKFFWVLISIGLASVLYAKEAIIVANSLNVRDIPNGKKIDKIKQNTSVIVIEAHDGWSHIAYDGKRGWVSSEFLTYKEPLIKEKTPPNKGNKAPLKLQEKKLITTCQTEQRSKAKVCLKTAPATLVCHGSTCEVIFQYQLTSSYNGTGFLYADLDFKASLKFSNGSIANRLKQTGHSFFQVQQVEDEIHVPFALKKGMKIDDITLEKAQAKVTQVKYYH